MSTTRIRGLSDAYGSWKIICILSCCRARRVGRRARERLALPAALAGGKRQEAHREPAQRRLAAPGFADEARRPRPSWIARSTPSTAWTIFLAQARRRAGCRCAPRRRATSRSASTRATSSTSGARRRPRVRARCCGARHGARRRVRADGGNAPPAARRRRRKPAASAAWSRRSPSRGSSVHGTRSPPAGRAPTAACRGSASARAPRTLRDGTESRRPCVYGCRGCDSTSNTLPCSTMRPAYMTLT